MLKLKYLKDKTLYNVDFFGVNGNVVTLSGDFPIKEEGFTLSRPDYEDNWDYSKFKTLYRKEGNKVEFSNDGSVYVEPTKKEVVQVAWSDMDNELGIRPSEVKVNVFLGNEFFKEFLEEITLNEECEWKKEYEIKESENIYVEGEDIPDYTKAENGSIISYYTEVPQPENITVDDLAMAITEIYEMIDQNSSDITITQEAVAEIYEMLG